MVDWLEGKARSRLFKIAKETLRKGFTAKRDALEHAFVESASSAIVEKVLSLPEWRSAREICLYKSINNEVCTERLIEAAWVQKKRVSLPIWVNGEWRAARLRRGQALVLNSFGFPEPRRKHFVDLRRIRCLIVPCIAFDEQGHCIALNDRYETFLQRLSAWAPCIALAFEAQRVVDSQALEKCPRVHKIITEARVIEVHATSSSTSSS